MEKKIKYYHQTEDFRVIKTNDFREKIKFIYFPIFLNKKIYWLQKVKITERKYIEQIAEFDDGWSYRLIWQNPYDVWEIEKIEKIKD